MEGRNVPPPAPIIDLDGNERFIVEEVLDHRRKRMDLQYLVRWKGYPDATWEPAAFLQDEDGHDIIQLQSYKSKNFRSHLLVHNTVNSSEGGDSVTVTYT